MTKARAAGTSCHTPAATSCAHLPRYVTMMELVSTVAYWSICGLENKLFGCLAGAQPNSVKTGAVSSPAIAAGARMQVGGTAVVQASQRTALTAQHSTAQRSTAQRTSTQKSGKAVDRSCGRVNRRDLCGRRQEVMQRQQATPDRQTLQP